MSNKYYLLFTSLFLTISLILVIMMERYHRQDIQEWCQTQNYQVVEIEHNFWSTGPFILSGKGYSIFEVKVGNGIPVLWFRYSIWGRDIYQENNNDYIQLN